MFPEDTVPPPPPVPKPKRNLLFSSTSRKERERAPERNSEPRPLVTEPAEPQPASFDDTWLRPDRAKPGEIPFERSAKFDLVVNQKIAKSLGISIPQSVLLRADRVIE